MGKLRVIIKLGAVLWWWLQSHACCRVRRMKVAASPHREGRSLGTKDQLSPHHWEIQSLQKLISCLYAALQNGGLGINFEQNKTKKKMLVLHYGAVQAPAASPGSQLERKCVDSTFRPNEFYQNPIVSLFRAHVIDTTTAR